MYREKGYSLIEYLAVIIIVGILGAVATARYFTLIEEAKLKAHLANINTLQKTIYVEQPFFINANAFKHWFLKKYPHMICPWSGEPYEIYNGAVWAFDTSNKCRIGFLTRRYYYFLTAYHYTAGKDIVLTAVKRYGGCNREYVVVKNITSATLSLDGWYITDSYGRYSYKFIFSGVVLGPGETFKVWAAKNYGGVWLRNGKPGKCFGGINNNYRGQYDMLLLFDDEDNLHDFTDENNPVNGSLSY